MDFFKSTIKIRMTYCNLMTFWDFIKMQLYLEHQQFGLTWKVLALKVTSDLGMKPMKKFSLIRFLEILCPVCHNSTIYYSSYLNINKWPQLHLTCSKDYQCRNMSRSKFYVWIKLNSTINPCLIPQICMSFSTSWISSNTLSTRMILSPKRKEIGFTDSLQVKVMKK